MSAFNKGGSIGSEPTEPPSASGANGAATGEEIPIPPVALGTTYSETEMDETDCWVVNKDTGQRFKLTDVEQHINYQNFSLFPSRDQLQSFMREDKGNASKDSDDDDSTGKGSAKDVAMNKLNTAFGSLMKMAGRGRESFKQDQSIPGLVKVTVVKKDSAEFGDLRLVQCLAAHEGPIWTMKFSQKGEYLASAGNDHTVVVWVVGVNSNPASAAGRSTSTAASTTPVVDECEASVGDDALRLLKLEPHRRFTGHTADVIDLSWNKDNFLLSASIDKSVRLWHVARPDCLHVFTHVDCVTSVDFHPRSDHYFVSGCFDKKLRVWNVTDGRVKEWANTPDMITAACFNPEGTMAVAGLFKGQVFFYTTDGMKYYTQIECRNRHGALKGGKKVTGLCYDTSKSSQVPSEQLLITTNDSRLRLYQTDDYSMLCKYKGLTNDHMQIKASFSEDGQYVIAGSENGSVYVWNATSQYTSMISSHLNGFKKDRNTSYESFPATDMSGANPPIVSVAIFAPTSAVVLASHGTLFDSLLSPSTSVNKMIVAADYSGKIRVFHRHSLTNPSPIPNK